MMPLADGFELCNTLKTDTRTSHIPIILLTAKVSFESKIEGLETGADDYLTKPFSAKELKLRIKNMLFRQEQMQKRFSQQIINVNAPIVAQIITESTVDAEFLQKATQIVEEYLSDATFDVTKFCKEIAMSRQTLHRKLKAITGQATTEFIRSIRLKKAGQLLKKQGSRVDEVAWQTGFNDLAYFRKCFKKQFNSTPSEYK
jgi:YesN/AraC family two-component response regulator